MKRNGRILLGILLVACLAFTIGCGTKKETDKTESTDKTASTDKTESTDDTDKKVIKVAASATPHAEILEQAKKILANEGYDLQITIFDDYVQPNLVVNSGEFDANYFQHTPYLEDFNAKQNTDLVSVAKIHYEPLGIYPGTKSKLEDLAKGDVIVVPNDSTNEARALQLLEANGIITLKKGVGLEATVKDIKDNPYEIQIKELEAAQIPRARQDAAFVVLNGNYALVAGLVANQDALVLEAADSEAASTYANIIAVKKGNEKDTAILKLVEALQSKTIQDYINDTYNGAVIFYQE